MLYIRRFFDRLTAIESRQSKDLVIPVAEARGLRDDISKLLLEQKEKDLAKKQEIIDIQVKGGSFK